MNSKRRKLRAEAALDFRSGVFGVVSAFIERAEIDPFQTCVTCTNFDHSKELCKLCGLRPPADVIAYGCPMYDDDTEIPF